MAPLKPGDSCQRKAAPYCPGRILRADPDAIDAHGKKKKNVWVVEFDLANGEKSIEQGMSSRMLKRVATAPATAPPPLEETDVSSSHNETEEVAYLSGEFELRLNLDDDDSSEDEDEEEMPLTPPADMADETEDEDVPVHGEIPVEPEDIHKAKWEKYVVDKAELLAEGWTVGKIATSNQGIGVGATVRTKKKANSREGLVIGETMIGGGKQWVVSFGDTEPEDFRPQLLTLVGRSVNQEYVWTLVDDLAQAQLKKDVEEKYHLGKKPK
jgi:hypothetical protein